MKNDYPNGTFATIRVDSEDARAWPVVERVGSGWQSGAHHYPDEIVSAIRPLRLVDAEPTTEFGVAAICGSMRFYDRMIKVAERLTGEGVVVLMPFVTVQKADQGDDFKAMLDRMHRQKIDMSDYIVVVTDTDSPYIGDSTNGEIQYAASTAKPIKWALERVA